MNAFRYLGRIIDKSASMITMTSNEKFAFCSFVRIYLVANFTIVHNLLKYYCSSHFVFVFMDYRCGSRLVPSALSALKLLIINALRNLFRFSRYGGVTGILLALGLPSFDTFMWNAERTFIA